MSKETSHFHQFAQCHSDPGGQGEKPQWAPWRGQTPVTLASVLDTLHGPLLTASAIQSFKIARSLQVPHHVTRPKPCRGLELAPWPPLSALLSLQTAPAHLLKAWATHQLVLLSLIEQGLMIILALRHLEQRVWPRSDYCVGDCGSHLRRCDSGSACHRCSQVLTKPSGTLPLRATKEKGKALHSHGIGLLIYLLGVCFSFLVFIYWATCEVPPDWRNDGVWGGRGELLH